MADATNVIDIPALFQNKPGKRLIFSRDGLTIEKPNSFDPAVFVPAENISAIRYGVNWFRGYKFTFGRQYLIQIKDFQDSSHSIKLNSYYGVRRETYYKLWSDIFAQLWNYYFVNTYNYYITLYDTKQDFVLADVTFSPYGISWYDGGLFWSEIALSNYKTYFMIHHKTDLKRLKRCSFTNDLNAFILQRLLKKIVEEHKPT